MVLQLPKLDILHITHARPNDEPWLSGGHARRASFLEIEPTREYKDMGVLHLMQTIIH